CCSVIQREGTKTFEYGIDPPNFAAGDRSDRRGMSMSVKVSVVIPTRNRAALLRRAIDSVLAQTSANLEIIVVLDGPDRDSELLLKNHTDDRVRHIVCAEACGGAEARNIGVRAGTGEYIAFLDDDDEWLPTKLEEQLRCIRAQADAQRTIVTSRLI